MPPHHTLRLLPRQSLFGTLADKIPFYLCRQAESESKDFALDVVAEAIVVLDSPDTAFLGHADIQYLHDHKEISAQTGQLTADDDVVFLHLAKQTA